MNCVAFFVEYQNKLHITQPHLDLSGNATTSFPLLKTDFSSPKQIKLSWHAECLWTFIFKSSHRFSILFRSRLCFIWLFTWVCFDLNYSIVAIDVYSGLSCCKLNPQPIASSSSFCSVFSCILLKKSIPTTRCCHHHISQSRWCVQVKLFSSTHSYLPVGHKHLGHIWSEHLVANCQWSSLMIFFQ